MPDPSNPQLVLQNRHTGDEPLVFEGFAGPAVDLDPQATAELNRIECR
jgi:hypothetical protein